jgi:hypothetical protein
MSIGSAVHAKRSGQLPYYQYSANRHTDDTATFHVSAVVVFREHANGDAGLHPDSTTKDAGVLKINETDSNQEYPDYKLQHDSLPR